MKKFIIILSIVFAAQSGIKAQAQYMQAMGENLGKIGQAQSPEELQSVAAVFERISNAEADKWEPAYWAALCYINSSYMVDGKENKDAILDKAEVSVEKALEIAAEESEVLALEGYLYQARIGADGSRGMTMSQKAGKRINKALKLNPNNPRALFLKAQNTYYTPGFFGGGAKNALPVFEEAAEKFKSFRSDNPFAPVWGEELNQSQLEKCKGELGE